MKILKHTIDRLEFGHVLKQCMKRDSATKLAKYSPLRFFFILLHSQRAVLKEIYVE